MKTESLIDGSFDEPNDRTSADMPAPQMIDIADSYGRSREQILVNQTQCHDIEFRHAPSPWPQLSFLPEIPKHFFQTGKTYNLSNLEICSLLSGSAVMPDYKQYFHDDAAGRQFISDVYPQYLRYYNNFTRGVQRADFWRYAIVLAFGGVYADADVVFYHSLNKCVPPGSQTKEPIRMVVGIEGMDLFRPVQITNWAFAGSPGHYILQRTLERIIEVVEYRQRNNITYGNTPMEREEETIELTGPAVLTDSVEEYLGLHGKSLSQVAQGDIQIGDLYILRASAFGCGTRASGCTCEGPGVCLKHYFRGSWKINSSECNRASTLFALMLSALMSALVSRAM